MIKRAPGGFRGLQGWHSDLRRWHRSRLLVFDTVSNRGCGEASGPTLGPCAGIGGQAEPSGCVDASRAFLGGQAKPSGCVDASRAFSFLRTYAPVYKSRWIRQPRLVVVYCGSISVVCSASGCTLGDTCNRPAGASHACYASLNINIKGTLDRGAATICSRAARQRWLVPENFPTRSTHK